MGAVPFAMAMATATAGHEHEQSRRAGHFLCGLIGAPVGGKGHALDCGFLMSFAVALARHGKLAGDGSPCSATRAGLGMQEPQAT